MEHISLVAVVLQALVTTIFAGLASYPIGLYWHLQQRRRELAMETGQKFYSAYGAFFATWKLWNHSLTNATIAERASERRTLLGTATQSEAEVEAILVKLVCERDLAAEDIEALGKFRQAYQQLREAIRDDRPLEWDRPSHPEYAAFKKAATAVSSLIATIAVLPRPQAKVAVSRIIAVTDEKWERSWTEALSTPPDIKWWHRLR